MTRRLVRLVKSHACPILGHNWDAQVHHGTAVRLCFRCARIEWHR